MNESLNSELATMLNVEAKQESDQKLDPLEMSKDEINAYPFSVPGMVVHDNRVQGAGKTAQVLETALKYDQAVAFFGDRHSDLEHLAKEFDLRRVQGKAQVCQKKSKKNALERNASSQVVCNGCDYKEVCEELCCLKEIIRRKQSFVAPYEFLELLEEGGKIAWNPDLVIIDEDPERVILKKEKFGKKDIEKSLNYFRKKPRNSARRVIKSILRKAEKGLNAGKQLASGQLLKLARGTAFNLQDLDDLRKGFSK